jgi:hypothetical protein
MLNVNHSSYIAAHLAGWLKHQVMDHVRRTRLHPWTQGNIER